MANMVITEALAEVKTIDKRCVKKEQNIMRYFARQADVLDPLDKTGGSEKYIEEHIQSLKDLRTRKVLLRTAIQRVNLDNTLTVGKQTKTVADWLVWRKEVADSERYFIDKMINQVNTVRLQAGQQRKTVVTSGVTSSVPEEVIICVDEQALGVQAEDLENILGTLDGKLSLFNARQEIPLEHLEE